MDGQCAMRMESRAGKGDRVHLRGERPYAFWSPEALLRDFWRLVDEPEEGRR